MKRLRIKTAEIPQWLSDILATGHRVLAPVSHGTLTDFEEIRSASQVDYTTQTTRLSPKAAVFPKSEVLFTYKRDGHDTTLEAPREEERRQVIWRLRPCDAAAFAPLQGIFDWDSPDEPFDRRKARTLLVAFTCTEADEACFCTSVGGSPGGTSGCDILVTPFGEESLVEILTAGGEALLSENTAALFSPVTEGEMNKADVAANVPARFTADEVRAHVEKAFDSQVWKQQSERCLGCGACAFVCPTCACFDIQEDKHGHHGRRLRCWDSCGFGLFTQHTSGHNPRPTQATRWRQRILHKFAYMPQRQGHYGCVGCGRCSRACPVDMNLQEHLTQLAHSDHE